MLSTRCGSLRTVADATPVIIYKGRIFDNQETLEGNLNRRGNYAIPSNLLAGMAKFEVIGGISGYEGGFYGRDTRRSRSSRAVRSLPRLRV